MYSDGEQRGGLGRNIYVSGREGVTPQKLPFGLDLCRDLPPRIAAALYIQSDQPGSTFESPFAQGGLVGEYCGEVISLAEARQRLSIYRQQAKEPQMALLSHNRAIDATEQGSLVSQYAQHMGRRPINTVLQRWIVQGEDRVALFATTDISRGEEILFDKNMTFMGAIEGQAGLVEAVLKVIAPGGSVDADRAPLLVRCMADASNADEARMCLDTLERTVDPHAQQVMLEQGGLLVLNHVLKAKNVHVLATALKAIARLPAPSESTLGYNALMDNVAARCRHEDGEVAAAARSVEQRYRQGPTRGVKREAEESRSQRHEKRHRSPSPASSRKGSAGKNPSISDTTGTKTPGKAVPAPVQLPPGWRSAKDAQNRIYYYHEKTRKPQWNPPPMDDPPKQPDASIRRTSSTSSTGQANGGTNTIMIGNQRIEIPPPTQPVSASKPTTTVSQPAVTLLPQPPTSAIPPPFNPATAAWAAAQAAQVQMALSAGSTPAKPPANTATAPAEMKKPTEISSEKKEKAKEKKKTQSKTESAKKSSKQTGDSKEKKEFREKLSQIVIKALQPYMKDSCKEGRITSKDDFKHCARKLTHFIMEKHEQKGRPFTMDDHTAKKAKAAVPKFMARYGPVYKSKSKGDD